MDLNQLPQGSQEPEQSLNLGTDKCTDSSQTSIEQCMTKMASIELFMGKMHKSVEKFTEFMNSMVDETVDSEQEEDEHEKLPVSANVTPIADTQNSDNESTSTPVTDLSNKNPDTANQSSFFTDRLNLYEKVEPTAKDINPEFAKLVNKLTTTPLTSEEFKKLSETYVRPGNTTNLVCPKINTEIWDILPPKVREQDSTLQDLQKRFVKGMIPLVQAIDKEESTEIRTLLMASLALLGNASVFFNFHRRANMKDHMQNVKSLVSRETPISSQLFGDEIDSEINKLKTKASLKETMSGGRNPFKAGSSLQGTAQFGTERKFHPYKGKKNDKYYKTKQKFNSFLGQRWPVHREGAHKHPEHNHQRRNKGQSTKGPYRGQQ